MFVGKLWVLYCMWESENWTNNSDLVCKRLKWTLHESSRKQWLRKEGRLKKAWHKWDLAKVRSGARKAAANWDRTGRLDMPRCYYSYILKKHVNQSYTTTVKHTKTRVGNGNNATISYNSYWQPKKTISVALKRQQQQKHDTPISLNEAAANYSICSSNKAFVNHPSGEYRSRWAAFMLFKHSAVLLRHKLHRTFVRCSFRFIDSIEKLNRSQITSSAYSSPEATNNKQGLRFCEYLINRLSSASIFARLFFIHCLAGSGGLGREENSKVEWMKKRGCMLCGEWRDDEGEVEWEDWLQISYSINPRLIHIINDFSIRTSFIIIKVKFATDTSAVFPLLDFRWYWEA